MQNTTRLVALYLLLMIFLLIPFMNRVDKFRFEGTDNILYFLRIT